MVLAGLEVLEAEDSKVEGFSKGTRVEVDEVEGGEAEVGDQEGHLDTIWRSMYKTTIPRKASHEMSGKISSITLRFQASMISSGRLTQVPNPFPMFQSSYL